MTENLFSPAFFAGNRERLLNELGFGALVVLTAHGHMQRGSDSAFHFEQEANFWYLTGIDYPDWWLILDGNSRKCWLVRPEADEIRDIFDGSLNDKAALKISGADAVLDRTEARRMLGTLHGHHSVAYSLLPQAELSRYGFYPNPAPRELQDELRLFSVRDCRQELARLRAIKQDVEISALQKAINITIDGLKTVYKQLGKSKYEYEIEALLSYEFRMKGAEGHAYDPIVAGGKNACTLHYVDNNSLLNKKEWLLADVGARYQHYCADITRTIPLNKTPTKRQRAVYEAVERVQKTAIKLCVAGQSVADYNQAVETAMRQELIGLGLMKEGDGEDVLRQYFPHAISHGLGIDVHDALGRPTHFAAGMVLTVEPGIYIPKESIGVRIEDDILITVDGPKNLSRKLPSNLDKLLALTKS